MQETRISAAVTPSLTRKLFNMAQTIGEDVINLTLGDPDVLPPEAIRTAACEAIMAGKTRYSANAGLIELRRVYAGFFARQYGFAISPEKNILTAVGGMEALYLTLCATVEAGDEVIILGPYYVNYLQMIRMCGAEAVVVDRLGKDDAAVAADIRAAVTERTKAIIVNSPSNPAGDILSPALLDDIADIVRTHGLWAVSDEVYSSLIYDGGKPDSLLLRPGMTERTVLIDSCSKRFAMTGWRVGFAVGPEAVIASMTKMQENVAACAPLPSQYAAIKAYSGDVDYDYIRQEYQHRRDIVADAVAATPRLSCVRPQATFYCFVDISETGMDSENFAYALLEREHVAVVPGIAYGEAYRHYVRIAFTLRRELLTEAMARIRRFCETL